MIYGLDSKIIGAFLVGFGVVALSYNVSNAEKAIPPTTEAENTSVIVVQDAPARTAIAVEDSNNDGVEDWQDEFLTAEPIKINSNQEDYVPPTTLTDQLGVSFMQNILLSKTHTPYGKSKEEVIKDTVDQIKEQAKDKIYDTRDIKIIADNSNEAVRNYGNAMADAIINNGTDKKVRDEFTIMKDITNNGEVSERDLQDLKILSEVYLNTLNASLAVPVPKIFAKEHLDLINVYNALYKDAEGLAKIKDDPLVSLLRAKRLEDDVKGLTIALENIYYALEKSDYEFNSMDSAVFFASFAPNHNRP